MELWSLLNFLIPDIFEDADEFESWFNFNKESSSDAGAQNQITEEGKFLVI